EQEASGENEPALRALPQRLPFPLSRRFPLQCRWGAGRGIAQCPHLFLDQTRRSAVLVEPKGERSAREADLDVGDTRQPLHGVFDLERASRAIHALDTQLVGVGGRHGVTSTSSMGPPICTL